MVSTRRKNVFEKYGGRCFYCGEELDIDEFHMDHKIPQAKGGPGTFANLEPACCLCNMTKGPLDIEEFRLKIMFLRYDNTSVKLFCKYHDIPSTRVSFYFEEY